MSEQTDTQAKQQTPRLSLALAMEIGGALDKLQQLGENKIVSNEVAAERRALEDYLRTTLRVHAEELILTWVTMKQEFEPLVSGLRSLFRRTVPVAVPTKANPAAAEAVKAALLKQARESMRNNPIDVEEVSKVVPLQQPVQPKDPSLASRDLTPGIPAPQPTDPTLASRDTAPVGREP